MPASVQSAIHACANSRSCKSAGWRACHANGRTTIGHDFGVTDAHIQADDTAGEPTLLDDMAKTVPQAAREMTDEGAMPDTTFVTLQKALGNALVGDLMTTIAFDNAVVRVLSTLEIDVKGDYMWYLRRFPLPA